MVEFDDLTEQQQDAATALDRSVSLTAGAGTGKTTTLTERYFRMIAASIPDSPENAPPPTDPDAPVVLPRNVLTTTFTERAAEELQASIRETITERIPEEEPAQFPYWRAVADGLDDGYLNTLHGFCARLLREHAFAVDGLDPGFDTLDEEETAALIDETVDRVLASLDDGAEGHSDADESVVNTDGTAVDADRSTVDTDESVVDADEAAAVETLARQFDRRGLHDILTDLLGDRPESVAWAERVEEMDREAYLAFVQRHLHPVDSDDAATLLAKAEFTEAVETLREIVSNPPDIDVGGKAWTRAAELVDLLDGAYDDGVPSREKQQLLASVSNHLTKSDGERYADYTAAKSRWSGADDAKERFDDAITTIVAVLEPETNAVDVDPEADAAAFPFVDALATLTLAVADEYDRVKRERNAADFTDLVTKTLEFLRDDRNESVRAELREQFDYVMVDEFQDTDPRQWDLVRLLTVEDPTDFDAENVFVVGDVKQSIYRFRNADVAQFSEITAQLDRASETDTDGRDDQLSTNFRTLPTVLDTINELFETVFDPDGEQYEAEPQWLEAHRDDPAGVGSVEYLAVPTDADLRRERFSEYERFATANPDDDVELEGMALAARLTQLLAEPAQVYPEPDESGESERDSTSEEADEDSTSEEADEDSTPEDDSGEQATPRDVRPDDIAVLIRSRTDLDAYERALKEAGVPYSVASGLGFYETPEVTALVNLLRVLADPRDDRALYAVLRSPLFGFTDDTLARLTHDTESLWAGLEATEQPSLVRAFRDLRRWRQLAGATVTPTGTETGDNHTHESDSLDGDTLDVDALDGSWAALLTEVIEETGYLTAVSGDERPAQARANVEKFREQVRRYSEDGVGSLTTLVERIERRMDQRVRESEADATGDGVQIMTIHDAKGMEFPVVVVPGISRGFNDEAALGGGRIEFEAVGDTHALGMKAPGEDAFEFEDTMARETLRDRRRREERAEEKRVLYVACTRARDRLLLCGRHDSDGESEEPTLTDIEDADPEAAGSWRDWVQHELLDESVLESLDTEPSVHREFGEGSYTVSLPTPPVSLEVDEPDPPRVERSPAPSEPKTRIRLSATDYASLVNKRQDGADREDGSTEQLVSANRLSDSAEVDRARREDVSATAFGKAVHKICELRPPEDRWRDVARQMFAAEDVGHDEGTTAEDVGHDEGTAENTGRDEETTDEGDASRFDQETFDKIRTHARYGIDFVDELADTLDVSRQYDELAVTADLDSGEVFGYVDHLLVTPSRYHIVDYKTGSVAPDGVEAAGREYLEQMKPYAVAVSEDSDRDVVISVVFTEREESWTVRLNSEELVQIRDEIEGELRRIGTDRSS
jgi:ATP-dependent helicase/nuclease subunit A